MNVSFSTAFAFVVGTMAAGILVAMVWPALGRARRERHFAMVDVLLASSYIGTSSGAAPSSTSADPVEKRRAARAEEPEAGGNGADPSEAQHRLTSRCRTRQGARRRPWRSGASLRAPKTRGPRHRDQDPGGHRPDDEGERRSGGTFIVRVPAPRIVQGAPPSPASPDDTGASSRWIGVDPLPAIHGAARHGRGVVR